jgi:hypothetical protein
MRFVVTTTARGHSMYDLQSFNSEPCSDSAYTAVILMAL